MWVAVGQLPWPAEVCSLEGLSGRSREPPVLPRPPKRVQGQNPIRKHLSAPHPMSCQPQTSGHLPCRVWLRTALGAPPREPAGLAAALPS